jgi:galactokinase
MAVETDMIMVFSVSETNKIEIANTDSQFEPQQFELPDDGSLISIDASELNWANYFKCGLVVAQEFMQTSTEPPVMAKTKRCKGMKVVIDGNVPTGSGLSSSAAFVVCATLSILLANDYERLSKQKITKKLLTKLSTVCEQHVGVNSGGMDQSASIFGLKGHALNVGFYPELSIKPFAFPSTSPKLSFVIANSLITANKHTTGPVNYNLRVVEVTIGALIMAKRLGLTIRPDGNLQAGTFRGVMDEYFNKNNNGNDQQQQLDDRAKLAKMIELVQQLFDHKDEGYTTEQVAEELGMTLDQVKQKYMTKFVVRYTTLQLYKRAYHVYAESKRVLDFLHLLETYQHGTHDDTKLLQQLGGLMNQSHESARLLFNNSCPELDTICTIALTHGAYGSRVTGAGFGGSSVHLVPADKAQGIMQALKDHYYRIRFPAISDRDIDEALLVSEPSSGTTIIEKLSLD